MKQSILAVSYTHLDVYKRQDMEDMLRIFLEEDLSEFFYYQDGEDWKYDLK